MILNNRFAFREEPEKRTLEKRVFDLELQVAGLKQALNIYVQTDPNFYRGYDAPIPTMPLGEAIKLILDHLDLVLYETSPIGSQRLIRTKKDVMAERKKANEPT